MNELEERALYEQLLMDDSKRDRGKYDYTIDALLEGALVPYAIWPESNQNVAGVIKGEIDYNTLPVDEVNDAHKGMLFSEQQDVIVRNNGKQELCEALEMAPCLKSGCTLYNASLGPPVCREFKMAFRR